MGKAWKVILAAAVIGTVAGSAALAQGEGGAKEKHKQSDGRHRGDWFKEMDTNTNGTVSLAEFIAAHEKRMAELKARMGDKFDAEKANKMPPPEETFKKMDADGNGEVTKEEMQKWRDSNPRPERKHDEGE